MRLLSFSYSGAVARLPLVSCRGGGSLPSLPPSDIPNLLILRAAPFPGCFSDAGMLARAAHGIWSTSGFSNIARWWQGGGAERNFVIERSRDGPGCYSFSEVGGPNMV